MEVEHDPWMKYAPGLRALARQLVSDPHGADDLVQETLLVALQTPAEKVASPRLWIAGVLRNLLRHWRRDEKRRRAEGGEPRAWVELSDPDSVEQGEQALTTAAVAQAVHRLREPYRSTVVLRYYENLPPRTIAAMQSVPVATVNTRLYRAHRSLRSVLRKEAPRSRRSVGATLAALFLPWRWRKIPSSDEERAPPRRRVWSLATGLVFLVSLAVVVSKARREPERWNAAWTSDRGIPVRLVDHTLAPSPRVDRASRFRNPEEVVAEDFVHGRLVDVQGRGLAEIAIEFQPGSADIAAVLGPRFSAEGPTRALGVTAADGRFHVPRSWGPGVVRAKEPDYATVFAAHVSPSTSREEPLAVVAPVRSIRGRVLDTDDRSLPSWKVRDTLLRLKVPSRLYFEFPLSLAHSLPWEHLSPLGDPGTFAFDHVPDVEGARMELIQASGHWQPIPLERGPAHNLIVTVEDSERRLVIGEIRDPEGRLIPRALLVAGDRVVFARQGIYRFPLEESEESVEVTTWANGLLPVDVTLSRRSSPTIRFTDPAAILEGTVRDARGAPVPDALVLVVDEPRLQREGGSPILLYDWLGPKPGPGVWHDGFDPATFYRKAGFTGRAPCFTDAEGRFRFVGVLPKSHQLVAFRSETMEITAPAPAIPGDSAQLVFPHSERVRVAGRVTLSNGEPVAGARLSPWKVTVDSELGGFQECGDTVISDDQGWFEFPPLCPRGLRIGVDGEDILEQGFALDPRWGPGDQRLVVRRGVPMRVVTDRRTHAAVDCSFFGPEGSERSVIEVTDSDLRGCRWTRRVSFHSGRTGFLIAPDDVTTLVISREGVEIDRFPWEPRVGVMNIVRW